MKSRTCGTSGCLRINGKSDRLPCEGEQSELPSPTEGVCQKCKVHCSCPGRPSASLDEEDVLALSAGEWCETTGRSSLTASVAQTRVHGKALTQAGARDQQARAAAARMCSLRLRKMRLLVRACMPRA